MSLKSRCLPVLQNVPMGYSVWQCVAVCFNMLQCVAVCCSVLQRRDGAEMAHLYEG